MSDGDDSQILYAVVTYHSGYAWFDGRYKVMIMSRTGAVAGNRQVPRILHADFAYTERGARRKAQRMLKRIQGRMSTVQELNLAAQDLI